MYKSTNSTSIIRVTDGAFIPNDERNIDYRDYLAWVDAGNTAEPADLPPTPAKEVLAVTPWQIRKALNALELRDDVEAAVAAADQTTKDAWQYSTVFLRDNPLTISLGAALGKTTEEMDALFELAATL